MNRIFIGGYMHSGTSLLHHILSRHISINPVEMETKFFEYYDTINGSIDRTKDNWLHKYLMYCQYVYEFGVPITSQLERKYSKWQESYQEAKEFSPKSDDLKEIFLEYLDYKSIIVGCNYWVEKTPSNVYFVEDILRASPEAKLILIVRDGRDVLASKKKRTMTVVNKAYKKTNVKNKRLEKKYNVLLDAISWKSAAKICNMSADKWSKRVYLIRYEDLVGDPPKALSHLFSFLNLDFKPELLDINYSNAADRSKKRSGIYNNTGLFKKNLLEEEVIVSQFVMKLQLNKLNYKMDDGFFMKSRIKSLIFYPKALVSILDRLLSRYKLLGYKRFISYLKNVLQNKI
jgi:sulfotransferase family protein